MKKLPAVAMLCALAANAERLTVVSGKELALASPKATAAYVVDSEIADALLDRGVVLITGKRQGTTHLVVITAAGSETRELAVYEPSRVETKPGSQRRTAAPSPSGGWVESRFDSLGERFFNALTLQEKGRRLQTRLFISTLAYADRNFAPSAVASRFVLSGLSYDIRYPGGRITFFDQAAGRSPLTLDSSSIRGLHVDVHGFFAHVGYTSPAAFDDVFLPSRKEGVFGGGYRATLTSRSSLTFSSYRFTAPPLVSGAAVTATRPGTVVSSQYAYRAGDKLRLAVELGYSRSIGGSMELSYSKPGEALLVRFRYTPERFSALSMNRMPGLTADSYWNRVWSRRLSSDSFFYSTRYVAPGIVTTNLSAGGNLHYEATSHFTVGAGLSSSRFSSRNAPSSSGLIIPLSVGFHAHGFSAGMEYQRTRQAGSDEGGELLRPSISMSAGPVQLSAYALRQTQAPTLDYIVLQNSALQEALLELGLTAVTPQDIAAFLQQNSALIGQGFFQRFNIFLTPVRRQASGSATWRLSEGGTDLRYEFLYNGTQSISSSTQMAMHRVAIRRKLSPGARVALEWYGYAAKPAAASRFTSVWSVSLQQQFSRGPGLLVRERRGAIRGRVFEDLNSVGRPAPGSAGVAGVEIVLDGARRVRTGSDGRFLFSGVPEGDHRVTAQLESTGGYFTTPSVVETSENGEIGFGVARMLGALVGSVTNDAKSGVGHVTVILRRGEAPPVKFTTNGDGEFMASRIEYGEYEAEIIPESLPPGYELQETHPVTASVTPAAAGRVGFQVTALRSVGGRVETVDLQTGVRAGVPGVEITIRELGRKATTDQRGRFLFRNLPSGSLTLVSRYGDQSKEQTVYAPPEPAQIEDVVFTFQVPERTAPSQRQ